MNRYAIIRDVKNLPRERKIDLQNLVDECELIHDKTLSKHIDKVDLKRALICINERNYITGAAFFEEQNRVVYLDTLYILNSERKKGYGKQLLSVLKQYAKKKDSQYLRTAGMSVSRPYQVQTFPAVSDKPARTTEISHHFREILCHGH